MSKKKMALRKGLIHNGHMIQWKNTQTTQICTKFCLIFFRSGHEYTSIGRMVSIDKI